MYFTLVELNTIFAGFGLGLLCARDFRIVAFDMSPGDYLGIVIYSVGLSDLWAIGTLLFYCVAGESLLLVSKIVCFC